MSHSIPGWALPLAFAAFLVWGIHSAIQGVFDAPTVQRSVSTGECVTVLYRNPPKQPATCGTLPERYSVEWVE